MTKPLVTRYIRTVQFYISISFLLDDMYVALQALPHIAIQQYIVIHSKAMHNSDNMVSTHIVTSLACACVCMSVRLHAHLPA